MLLFNKLYYKDFFLKYVEDQNKFLICPVFIDKSDYEKVIKPMSYKNILFLTEPIKHFSNVGQGYEYVYKGYTDNVFAIIIGCIDHDPANGRFKFPLYLFENNFDIHNSEQFATINNRVSTIDAVGLKTKSFATLINSWDRENGARVNMYNRLIELGNISCPGKLLNNCSNDLLNAIGKAKYISKFLFNICPENYDYDNVPGYITEKLMDCCLSGAIPIYAGWIDEYDEKIFNTKRIICYNSQDEASYECAYVKVKELMENPDKLLAFYQQPVFCETAYDTIQQLLQDFITHLPGN
jgi:hypothetical protein